MKKDIAAESAARLSTAQVVEAKNTAARSAARLSPAQVAKAKKMAAESAAAAGQAAASPAGPAALPKIDEAPISELFARQPSFLAMRLAMLRQAVVDGIIILRKIDTKTNPANIFTTPLAGETLRRLRALGLGHHGKALGP